MVSYTLGDSRIRAPVQLLWDVVRHLVVVRYALLFFTIATLPATPLYGQPVPFFYRTDYALNYAQLGETGSVVIADLNNDGKMDFAIGAGFGIAVALGNGDGTFQPIMLVVPTGAGINGGWTLSSVAADFDGDGNVDLVLVPEGGDAAAVAILPGHGDGTFGQGTLVQAQGFLAPLPFAQVVGAADLNHDGRKQ
jgi:FG-GAP-like repeat